MGIPCCAWRGRTSSVHSNRSCTCLYADRTVCRCRPAAGSRTQRGVIVRPGVRAPPDSSMHRPVAVRHRPVRARLLPSRVLSSRPANRFQCPTGSARSHARSRLLPSARHRVPSLSGWSHSTDSVPSAGSRTGVPQCFLAKRKRPAANGRFSSSDGRTHKVLHRKVNRHSPVGGYNLPACL